MLFGLSVIWLVLYYDVLLTLYCRLTVIWLVLYDNVLLALYCVMVCVV